MTGANIIAFIILVAIVIAVVVYLLHWLYRRSSKDVSFVRTGLGGEQVVIGGGRLVLPIIHEVTEVGMKTLRLEVRRDRERSLITKNRLRVDLSAEFYVRVKPDEESVAIAAQTLGPRTLEAESLKDLVEGRFIDALRSVAASMTMEEIHEHRGDYVKAVKASVEDALSRNGLELEAVSLTALDQTDMEFFNASNAFDAEGLTRLTEEIETRKKVRNDIEKDTMIQIRNKNLEAERTALNIDRDTEYARLEQEREVSMRRTLERMEMARDKAERERETEQAQIEALEQIKRARIAQERAVDQARIEREQAIEALEIQRRRALEIAERDREIALTEKSREESAAQTATETERAKTVEAEEKVKSARDHEIAERRKRIELIEATQQAEREAIRIRTLAAAEKTAAEDRAEAERFASMAAQLRYEVDADGKRALNEAENLRSEASRKSALRMKVAENLEAIIRESVKPMERIGDIRILHVDGLPGLSGNGSSSRGSDAAGVRPSAGDGESEARGSLADSVVSSALRYRSQAPFVDNLLHEIGMDSGEITRLGNVLGGAQRKPDAKPRPDDA